MIVFIPLIAYLIYRSVRTKSKAIYSLSVFAIFCFLNYLDMIKELIYPLPYIIYGIGILSILACIIFSRREYVQAKRDYLKSRRKQREINEDDQMISDENHNKIIVERAGDGEQKVFYVKKPVKRDEAILVEDNVPYGTKSDTYEKDKTSDSERDIDEKRDECVGTFANKADKINIETDSNQQQSEKNLE